MKKSQLKTDSYNWNKRKASTQKHKQEKVFQKSSERTVKLALSFQSKGKIG